MGSLGTSPQQSVLVKIHQRSCKMKIWFLSESLYISGSVSLCCYPFAFIFRFQNQILVSQWADGHVGKSIASYWSHTHQRNTRNMPAGHWGAIGDQKCVRTCVSPSRMHPSTIPLQFPSLLSFTVPVQTGTLSVHPLGATVIATCSRGGTRLLSTGIRGSQGVLRALQI